MSSIRLPLICNSFEELVTHYDANADGEEGSDGASVIYTVRISPELYFCNVIAIVNMFLAFHY